MDIQVQKNLIEGMKQSLFDLRKSEQVFLEAKGLSKQIAKNQTEVATLETDLETMKEQRKEKVSQKNKAVDTTATALSLKMNAVLPCGNAEFKIEDDGKVFIGWDGKAHAGLSGGEISIFNSALCSALGCDIIIQESAELDPEAFQRSCEKLKDIPEQVIINNCHGGGEPDGFTSWFIL